LTKQTRISSEYCREEIITLEKFFANMQTTALPEEHFFSAEHLQPTKASAQSMVQEQGKYDFYIFLIFPPHILRRGQST
jgi:hypothetical protein